MVFSLFSASFHFALFSSGFQRVALLGEDCCGSRCWIKLYRCCIPLFPQLAQAVVGVLSGDKKGKERTLVRNAFRVVGVCCRDWCRFLWDKRVRSAFSNAVRCVGHCSAVCRSSQRAAFGIAAHCIFCFNVAGGVIGWDECSWVGCRAAGFGRLCLSVLLG